MTIIAITGPGKVCAASMFGARRATTLKKLAIATFAHVKLMKNTNQFSNSMDKPTIGYKMQLNIAVSNTAIGNCVAIEDTMYANVGNNL